MDCMRVMLMMHRADKVLHPGIDPIVQAASTIMRLQTIVSREVDPLDFAVVGTPPPQSSNRTTTDPPGHRLRYPRW